MDNISIQQPLVERLVKLMPGGKYAGPAPAEAMSEGAIAAFGPKSEV